MIKRKPRPEPDLEAFNRALADVAGVSELDGLDVARLFRQFFLNDETGAG